MRVRIRCVCDLGDDKVFVHMRVMVRCTCEGDDKVYM